jgi:hypothetical protein
MTTAESLVDTRDSVGGGAISGSFDRIKSVDWKAQRGNVLFFYLAVVATAYSLYAMPYFQAYDLPIQITQMMLVKLVFAPIVFFLYLLAWSIMTTELPQHWNLFLRIVLSASAPVTLWMWLFYYWYWPERLNPFAR